MLKLFLLLFVATSLFSKEPTLATLKMVIYNDTQKLQIGSYSFKCKAYGVISIEDILHNGSSNKACVDSLKEFYKKNVPLQYFSSTLLKNEQLYSIELKESECVIYANGQKTLSEFLLEEGLATMKRRFKDSEFRFSFIKAQLSAKIAQKGMWKSSVRSKCMADLIGE